MKTITITGRDKDIYNILQENGIRVKRHGLEITGDTDFEKPSLVAAKIAVKNDLAELRKEAKELNIKGFGIMKTDKLKEKIAAIRKEKENKNAANRKTKEEKIQLKTK